MKKLYTVTIEHRIVVLATSLADAEEVALAADPDIDPDISAAPLTFLPPDWDGGCIPIGAHEEPERSDWTIDHWVDAGAAPMYRGQAVTW